MVEGVKPRTLHFYLLITLGARMIIHAITQFFPSNSRFHALKYLKSRHRAFSFGGLIYDIITQIFEYLRAPPRRKRDGVIRHILERENGNWMEIIA